MGLMVISPIWYHGLTRRDSILPASITRRDGMGITDSTVTFESKSWA